MRTFLVAALATLALATHADAQTIDRSINLTPLGWGNVEPVPIDIDGDGATKEWTIHNDMAWRVIAFRDGTYCIGDWFTPEAPYFQTFTQAKVVHEGGRDKIQLTVRETIGEYAPWQQSIPSTSFVITYILFDAPVCPKS